MSCARIRYSCRSIGHSAETKQLLSCGYAHFRAVPNVARRPYHRPLRRAHSGSTSDSHGVFSPSTLQPERVHSTPACRTGYVPSSGFYTLSTACSSLERPALFHAGNAHGVLALQGFSLAVRSRRLVTGGFPSWRFSSHCGVNSAMLGTRFSATAITASASRAFAASRGLLRQ
jgi:hypothetical protein